MAEIEVYATREAWLEARQDGLGASEWPEVLGLVEQRKPFGCWARKTGHAQPQPATIPMRRGLALESLVRELYGEATGRPIEVPAPWTLYRHTELPWLTATPDGFAEIGGRRGALELKTGLSGRIVDGQAMPAAQVQLQAQLLVVGLEIGSIAGLADDEFDSADYERHQAFLDAALPRLERFWWHVCHQVPPWIDGSESTAHALVEMFPRPTETSIVLSPEAVAVTAHLEERMAQAKLFEEEIEMHKNQIKAEIGNATYGVLPDGRRWKWGFQAGGKEVKYVTKDSRKLNLVKAESERPRRSKKA